MTERVTELLAERRSSLGSEAWELEGEAESGAFRAAMRRVVGGVTVITTRHDNRPWGMTVSAFTPVCMEPPTLLVCLNNRTVTASNVSRDGRFAVNLLSQSQLHLSKLCSQAGEDKYLDEHIVPQSDVPRHMSMPVLRNSIVTFECKAAEVRPVGSHLVVMATIDGILAPSSLPPLLYGGGRYMRGVAVEELATARGAR